MWSTRGTGGSQFIYSITSTINWIQVQVFISNTEPPVEAPAQPLEMLAVIRYSYYSVILQCIFQLYFLKFFRRHIQIIAIFNISKAYDSCTTIWRLCENIIFWCFEKPLATLFKHLWPLQQQLMPKANRICLSSVSGTNGSMVHKGISWRPHAYNIQ